MLAYTPCSVRRESPRMGFKWPMLCSCEMISYNIYICYIYSVWQLCNVRMGLSDWPMNQGYDVDVSSSRSPLSANHGCFKQSSAVARRSGSKYSMGVRKLAKSCAAFGSHSYFSVSTSKRPHGFSFVMWRSSPEEKYTRTFTSKRSVTKRNR